MIATEAIVTHPRAGALPATPVQRAICRVIDGRPLGDLASDADVRRVVGDEGYVCVPHRPPRAVVLLAGVRAGKTLIAAAAAIRAALCADLAGVRRHEVVRSAIVSVDVDRARAALEHIHGLARTDLLRGTVVPDAGGAVVRRTDGRSVEVRVEAASRDGGTLVARWLAGVIYDEAPRMRGRSDGGVIALEDLRRAVAGRLRPGAQELIVGSPAGPRGAVYDIVTGWGGRQTPELVVLRADARSLNPSWWTEERAEALRVSDPMAYLTDVLGEWGAAEEALLAPTLVRAAMGPVPDVGAGARVVAAMDPATRGDAWTVVVAAEERGQIVVMESRRWRGTRAAPLDPGVVLRSVAEVVSRHGVREVWTDQASADALVALGRRAGVTVLPTTTTRGATRARAELLRAALTAGRLRLPEDADDLARDLIALRRRVGVGGETTVVLPRTGDGHCDGAAALLLALEALHAVVDEAAAGPAESEEDVVHREMRAAVMREMMRRDAAPMPWEVLR